MTWGFTPPKYRPRNKIDSTHVIGGCKEGGKGPSNLSEKRWYECVQTNYIIVVRQNNLHT